MLAHAFDHGSRVGVVADQITEEDKPLDPLLAGVLDAGIDSFDIAVQIGKQG